MTDIQHYYHHNVLDRVRCVTTPITAECSILLSMAATVGWMESFSSTKVVGKLQCTIFLQQQQQHKKKQGIVRTTNLLGQYSILPVSKSTILLIIWAQIEKLSEDYLIKYKIFNFSWIYNAPGILLYIVCSQRYFSEC